MQSEKNPATTRDFGTRGRALLRITGRRTGENRWIRAFYRAGDVTVRRTGRVARVFWLEVTGFLFLCLAVVGAAAGFREYLIMLGAKPDSAKSLSPHAFTLMFLYFGVNSFWRLAQTGGEVAAVLLCLHIFPFVITNAVRDLLRRPTSLMA